MPTYIQSDILYMLIFQTRRACQRKKKEKGKGEDHLDSSIKVKHKVKDRPFAEGNRGCHSPLGLDTQNLNAKECHFVLPLVCGPLLCTLSLLLLPQQVRTKLIFSALISHAYLESNFYCLHR